MAIQIYDDKVQTDRASLGGSVYDQKYFTDDELREAAKIRTAAQNGETDWASANASVNQMRAGHGYTGGKDGSQFLPTGPKSGFQYKAAPQWEDPYDDDIQALAQKYLNREAFSYDPEQDATYQQYKDSYTRQGKQAMEDTLAQVSARTGGLASSYANTASQQTYDGYMAALADKIPELKQLAYQMYMDEGNKMLQDVELMRGLRSDKRGEFQDELDQYNTDRTYNANQYWTGKEFDYNQEQDQKNREDQKQADARDRALSYLQAGGKAAQLPKELVEASGLSQAELNQYETAFAMGKTGTGGGYGGGNTSSGPAGSDDGPGEMEELLNSMYDSDDPEAYMRQHYKEFGFSRDDFEFIMNNYGDFKQFMLAPQWSDYSRELLLHAHNGGLNTDVIDKSIQTALKEKKITKREANALYRALTM